MPVRNKIKELIDRKGISVYRFQKDVGIAQGTAYSLYNNPSQLPSSTVIGKICDAYRVPVQDVLIWIPPEEILDEAPVSI
jgi:DNA-binding XRE family transcriptional regulator